MIDLYSDDSSDAEWEPIFVLVVVVVAGAGAGAGAGVVVVSERACALDCVNCSLNLTTNC